MAGVPEVSQEYFVLVNLLHYDLNSARTSCTQSGCAFSFCHWPRLPCHRSIMASGDRSDWYI